MRRIVPYGLVLIFLGLLFAASGPSAQRLINGDGGGVSSGPVAVSVANFPQVQPVAVDKTVTVTGSVSVTNLPAVQQVAGTVNVANLPVDATGRVVVAIAGTGSGALVLRSTSAMYQGNLGGRTGATQKCRAEFPSSHFATVPEIQSAWNTRGIVWLSSDTDWSWVDDLDLARNCSGNAIGKDWQAVTRGDGSRADGNLVREKGTDLFNGGPCSDAHPILCAE